MPTFSFLHRAEAGSYSSFELKAKYHEEHIGGAVKYVVDGDPQFLEGVAATAAACDINHGGGKGLDGKELAVDNPPEHFEALQKDDQLTLTANGDLVLQTQKVPKSK
jgi:hypothetical protein